MNLIPGRQIADQILKKLSAISDKQIGQLAVILVGDNPSSHLYVSIKEKKAEQIGLGFKKYLLPAKTKQAKIINLIQKLNHDKNITALIIQLPLPKHLDTHKIIRCVDSEKDADGLHPQNLNLLKHGQMPPALPATTAAILAALKYTRINLKNKSIAIIGKSLVVGLPTYYYFQNKVKKINIYDSRTRHLAAKTSRADILIVAIGSPRFITSKYVKKNAVVIDVGINKVYPVKSPTKGRGAKQFDRVNGKTLGDVDFNSVRDKARWLTPVPGGIGPLTVAMLLKNTANIGKKIHNS